MLINVSWFLSRNNSNSQLLLLLISRCPFGYVVGIFGTCVDYNECDDFPCENGGTCENKEGSYVCHCVTPYTGENCTLTRLEEPFVYFSSAALAAMLSCALVILSEYYMNLIFFYLD